jgi:hypothetical protein
VNRSRKLLQEELQRYRFRTLCPVCVPTQLTAVLTTLDLYQSSTYALVVASHVVRALTLSQARRNTCNKHFDVSKERQCYLTVYTMFMHARRTVARWIVDSMVTLDVDKRRSIAVGKKAPEFAKKCKKQYRMPNTWTTSHIDSPFSGTWETWEKSAEGLTIIRHDDIFIYRKPPECRASLPTHPYHEHIQVGRHPSSSAT